MKYLYVRCSDSATGIIAIEYVCTCRWVRNINRRVSGRLVCEIVRDKTPDAYLRMGAETHWPHKETRFPGHPLDMYTFPMTEL